MTKRGEWESRVSNLIKSELKLRGISYAELARRLQEIGVQEQEYTIASKLSRGRFSAVFFAQCLQVIGSDRLRLD
jgi:hypothetical protein